MATTKPPGHGNFFDLPELCQLAIQNVQLKACFYARRARSRDPEDTASAVRFLAHAIVSIYGSENECLIDAFRSLVLGAAIYGIDVLAQSVHCRVRHDSDGPPRISS